MLPDRGQDCDRLMGGEIEMEPRGTKVVSHTLHFPSISTSPYLVTIDHFWPSLDEEEYLGRLQNQRLSIDLPIDRNLDPTNKRKTDTHQPLKQSTLLLTLLVEP